MEMQLSMRSIVPASFSNNNFTSSFLHYLLPTSGKDTSKSVHEKVVASIRTICSQGRASSEKE